jgi:hypothetical protein
MISVGIAKLMRKPTYHDELAKTINRAPFSCRYFLVPDERFGIFSFVQVDLHRLRRLIVLRLRSTYFPAILSSSEILTECRTRMWLRSDRDSGWYASMGGTLELSSGGSSTVMLAGALNGRKVFSTAMSSEIDILIEWVPSEAGERTMLDESSWGPAKFALVEYGPDPACQVDVSSGCIGRLLRGTDRGEYFSKDSGL